MNRYVAFISRRSNDVGIYQETSTKYKFNLVKATSLN